MDCSMSFLSSLMFLIACLQCAGSSCSQIVSVTLSIQDSPAGSLRRCAPTNSTGYLLCPDLQSALDLLERNASSECWDARIYLRPGRDNLLERPVNLSTYSLLLQGTRGAPGEVPAATGALSTIVCKPFECETTTGQHALYFDRSRSVKMVDLSAEGCPCPFRFDSVANVSVQASSFSYFQEAVLDIYNCLSVRIDSCTFFHNRGTGVIQQPFRGNTGAVSICYYLTKATSPSMFMETTTNMDVTVTNTTFLNNSAIANNVYKSSSNAFFNGILTGRGGGLGIFISTLGVSHNVTALVSNCTFKDNFATSFGGALYFVYNGSCSQHHGVVEDTHFLSNTGSLGGGGFIITVDSGGLAGAPHTLEMSRCLFKGNQGNAGGGMYFYVLFQRANGSQLMMDGCTFTENGGIDSFDEFGAAVATSIYENFQEKQSFEKQHNISNCTFIHNSGSNAIVSLGHIPFVLSGRNSFINNTGSALRMTGSQLTIYGHLEFINNTAVDGAALELLSFGQLSVANGTQALFRGNSGRYGASIYVNSVEQTGLFQGFNTQCFLLPSENTNIFPSSWTSYLAELGINFTFTGNNAWFGPAIYATSLTACSWVGLSYPFINRTKFLDWPIFTFNDSSMGVENATFPVATNPVQISTSVNEFHSWPGLNLSLPLTLSDELENPAGSMTRLSIQKSKIDSGTNFSITPSRVLVSRIPYATNFILSVFQGNGGGDIPTDGSGYVGDIVIQPDGIGIFDLTIHSTSVPMYYEDCLGGYELTTIGNYNESVCNCETQEPRVLLCESDEDSIIIESGMWATVAKGYQHNLFFYRCPPGYCQCFLNSSLGPGSCASVFTNSEPDRQCACGRTGVLCGKCPDGTGVSVLLNRCVTCSKNNLMLVAALVLVDALVMAVIVFFDCRLPQICYPFLFYVQVASWSGFYFPTTFSITWKYMYYISNAMSFYFPYDFCLYGDMSAAVSYFLRFIPLLTATVICPTIYQLRVQLGTRKWASSVFSRFQSHGIWTVVLLIYTHTVAASVLSLVCPRVPDQNGTFTFRWYVDGSVQCFKGTHLALAIVSLIVLLSCAVLPIFLIFLSFRTSKIQCLNWLRNFGLASQKSYSEWMSWWSGVELARRLILIVLAATAIIGAPLQALALMVLVALYGYLRPYSRTVSNVLEVVVLVIFLVILLIGNNSTIVELSSLFPSSNASTFSEFASCYPDQGRDELLITLLTKLLTAIYYMPLLLFFVTILVAIVSATIKRYKPGIYNQLAMQQKTNDMSWKEDSSLHLSLMHEPLIPTTIVRLSETEN